MTYAVKAVRERCVPKPWLCNIPAPRIILLFYDRSEEMSTPTSFTHTHIPKSSLPQQALELLHTIAELKYFKDKIIRKVLTSLDVLDMLHHSAARMPDSGLDVTLKEWCLIFYDWKDCNSWHCYNYCGVKVIVIFGKQPTYFPHCFIPHSIPDIPKCLEAYYTLN